MNNRDRTVVGKVLDEIAIAESLMQNEDLASFLEDEKLKRAVCMTVINIGELVKNLTESFRLIHAQVPWKAIAGFRDIAAHKYQTLRMEDVYATVSDDFPVASHDARSHTGKRIAITFSPLPSREKDDRGPLSLQWEANGSFRELRARGALSPGRLRGRGRSAS